MSDDLAGVSANVAIRSCRMTRADISVPDGLAGGEQIQVRFNAGCRRLDVNGHPKGIEADVSLVANEGKRFSFDLTFRSLFEFPEGTSDETAELYLAKFGATRTIDAARKAIESLSVLTGVGSVAMPAMTFRIDPAEWHVGGTEQAGLK